MESEPAVTACLRLPATPRSPGQARQFAAGTCRLWRLDAELVDTAVLLCSELVANAVRHAGGGLRLSMQLTTDSLRLAVTDRDDRLPRLQPTDQWDEGRRGLVLVEALSADWGAEVHRGGKTVWCVVSRAPAGDRSAASAGGGPPAGPRSAGRPATGS